MTDLVTRDVQQISDIARPAEMRRLLSVVAARMGTLAVAQPMANDHVAFRPGHRDAFPSGDPSLRAALAHLGLQAPAANWRPWLASPDLAFRAVTAKIGPIR